MEYVHELLRSHVGGILYHYTTREDIWRPHVGPVLDSVYVSKALHDFVGSHKEVYPLVFPRAGRLYYGTHGAPYVSQILYQ